MLEILTQSFLLKSMGRTLWVPMKRPQYIQAKSQVGIIAKDRSVQNLLYGLNALQ